MIESPERHDLDTASPLVGQGLYGALRLLRRLHLLPPRRLRQRSARARRCPLLSQRTRRQTPLLRRQPRRLTQRVPPVPPADRWLTLELPPPLPRARSNSAVALPALHHPAFPIPGYSRTSPTTNA